MEPFAGSLRQCLPDMVRAVDPGPDGDALPVAEADPVAFWGRFLGAVAAGRSIALMDPEWPAAWRQQLEAAARTLATAGVPHILIATSGSTGRPKFCVHSATTLACAADGYAARFGRAGLIHSVVVLQPHHVGGLMPVLRAAACGGRAHFADYRDAAAIARAPFGLEQASLSVVPTQLRRMLQDPGLRQILRRFGLVLTGGAACPPDLLERAREEGLRLAPCYGATETAAMVTALDPGDFLAGACGVGTPMPHARIEVDDAGRVLVHSGANLLAYLPERPGFTRAPLVTGDIGHIDASGSLCIHGRADRVIITGGKKVHPEQVESAAVASGLVAEALCTGNPDQEWGFRVELAVVPAGGNRNIRDSLRAELRQRLPAYAVPKVITVADALPGS